MTYYYGGEQIMNTIEILSGPGKKFLKTKEAAKILRLAEGTLANMRSNNRGPPYIKVGGAILYDAADLLDYMRNHKIDPENIG